VDVEGTSFHADTILKAVEVFKMEAGLEKYAVGEEFHVFTPGSSNSCGPLWTNFGEEMLLDFNRIEGWSTYLEDGGLYVNVASQRIWSDLSEDDEEALRSCTCNGGCGTFQVVSGFGGLNSMGSTKDAEYRKTIPSCNIRSTLAVRAHVSQPPRLVLKG